jgi:hypothetical protein
MRVVRSVIISKRWDGRDRFERAVSLWPPKRGEMHFGPTQLSFPKEGA